MGEMSDAVEWMESYVQYFLPEANGQICGQFSRIILLTEMVIQYPHQRFAVSPFCCSYIFISTIFLGEMAHMGKNVEVMKSCFRNLEGSIYESCFHLGGFIFNPQ